MYICVYIHIFICTCTSASRFVFLKQTDRKLKDYYLPARHHLIAELKKVNFNLARFTNADKTTAANQVCTEKPNNLYQRVSNVPPFFATTTP